MRNSNFLNYILSGILITGLTACGGSSDSSDSDNSAPTVDAGDDQTVDELDTVTLDLTTSDEDGDTLTVTWSQQSGDDVTLSDKSAYAPTFTAPSVDEDSELVFQVSVDDGTNEAVTDTVTITVTDTDSDSDSDTSPWIVNNTTLSTYILEDTLNNGVVENVQSVETVTIDGVEYTQVIATDIPEYDVVITQDMIDELNSRPNASEDFTTGETIVTVGETIEFGQDIGYIEDTDESQNCSVTGGLGYWPPGPACPTEQDVEAYFPVEPIDTDEDCETGANSIGLLVNGAAIFNWGDTFSYATDTWYNVAPEAEQYDVDICGGHSANGAYHHHSYSSCIATLVGDEGDAHSPIYGYSADGYPLYGPYESDGELAISGWVKRDYSLSNSEGGCNSVDGERTCILVDEYDISQGVTELDTSSYGPDIGVEVETLSGNSIAADEGYYYEDYYYAQKTVTGAQLDEHNGHDTGDGKGYHYHVTLTEEDDGTLTAAFPYHMGPKFKAELKDNSLATCSTDTSTTAGPPQ